MAYFLLKTEPTAYSWAQLEKDKKTVWDGVANNLALKHIRAAKKGDLALIYHTGSERRAVGVAEIVSGPYPDPDKDNEKLTVFDVKAKKALAEPVGLDQLKAATPFRDSPLVRIGRLSVVPLTSAQWNLVLKMAGTSL